MYLFTRLPSPGSVKLNNQFILITQFNFKFNFDTQMIIYQLSHDGAMTRAQFQFKILETFFKFKLLSKRKIIEETNLAL